MFISFYDHISDFAGSWKILALTGVSLLLTAVLIFIIPELVAYLVATMLLWFGIFFIAVAFKWKRSAQNFDIHRGRLFDFI